MDFEHTFTNLDIENEYPKLVRDKIPEIIAKNDGIEVATETLADDKDFQKYLLKKVAEEAAELSRAMTDSNMVEEIVDVYEVIDALLALKGITREQVLAVQEQKRIARGGFKKRLLMLHKSR